MWYENFISFVFFALSVVLVVVAIVFVVGSFFSLLAKAKHEVAELAKGRLVIRKLGDDYKETKSEILETVLDKKEYKNYTKEQKKTAKKDKPENKVFVINFKGDIHA